MSMHQTPLTDIERDGLKAHGLPIGTPSQMSDCFRHGVKWAQEQLQAEESLKILFAKSYEEKNGYTSSGETP